MARYTYERLSAQDNSFLMVESPKTHMHVASTLIYDAGPLRTEDGGIEALALTEGEIDDLVAFLFALTDVRFSDANRAAMKSQRAHAAENRPFRDDDLANRRVLGFERRVLRTR